MFGLATAMAGQAAMAVFALESQRQAAMGARDQPWPQWAFANHLQGLGSPAHRCAYCRTLDTAAMRCPSCGAPR